MVKDQIQSNINSCILKKKDLKPDRSNVPKSLRLQIYQYLGPEAEHVIVPGNVSAGGYSDSCTSEACLHITCPGPAEGSAAG